LLTQRSPHRNCRDQYRSHLCQIKGCPRSAYGFWTKDDLRRHQVVVHPLKLACHFCPSRGRLYYPKKDNLARYDCYIPLADQLMTLAATCGFATQKYTKTTLDSRMPWCDQYRSEYSILPSYDRVRAKLIRRYDMIGEVLVTVYNDEEWYMIPLLS
jgi:hypothetical protein